MSERLLIHEQQYRGERTVAKIGQTQLTICGVGAVGSLLADNLARQGFCKMKIIDCDRVEEHNVNTQIFDQSDVGGWKAEIVRNRLFRTCENEVEVFNQRLESRNINKYLKGSQIVIDAFDNSESRQLLSDHCSAKQLNCLHVGLFEDYCEIIWNQHYKVPANVQGDVCGYPLARNTVLLAVLVASEVILDFVINEECRNLTATLGDLKVTALES